MLNAATSSYVLMVMRLNGTKERYVSARAQLEWSNRL